MMTEEQRIEWLLELQEHPEQLNEEQLQQILADDEMRQLVEQLGFAKSAFKHDELNKDITDVDAEWEKFASSHAKELDALDEKKSKPHFHVYFFTHKIAASFIGVLLASGIAFATIQIVRNFNTSKPQQPTTKQTADTNPVSSQPADTDKAVTIPVEPYISQQPTTEQTTDIEPVTSMPADTIKADSIPTETYVFDNVTLDSMLTAISAVHGIQVEYENETARELRFHFVWKREDSLTRVVEKLNTFEAVNIGMEDKTLVVR